MKGFSEAIMNALPHVYAAAGLYVIIAPGALVGRAAGVLVVAISVSLFKLRLDRSLRGRTLVEIAARRGAR